jgi:hypothetical protein
VNYKKEHQENQRKEDDYAKWSSYVIKLY